MTFVLTSSFSPTGDQPEAIDKLVHGLDSGKKHQVLLGVTGSGKTFTVANVIQKTKKPALIISHNKTLAAQLYQEFRDFFPKNAVSYFVSYYDYYQPEAYIPQTDTYIEKETEINKEIDKLRLAATTNILTRKDTIVVASVSCIYNLGSPKVYGTFILELAKSVHIARESIIKRLVQLQYQRSEYDFARGTFRIRGDFIDIYPAYADTSIRIKIGDNYIESIFELEAISGIQKNELDYVVIYPAKHYLSDSTRHKEIFPQIENELSARVKKLKSSGKILEAERLNKRVRYDIEMIQEMGYVNGIENYSRYFDEREPGDPPFTLLDYYEASYGRDWLLFIDESHMTIPQIRGMYNGDRQRKQTLIDFGFRLPSALDNRPLTFLEFLQRIPNTIYISATPSPWELAEARDVKAPDKDGKNDTNGSGVVEQLIRPTGILDPRIEIRSSHTQIVNLTHEIFARKKKKERVLVTTLTKKNAEDLSTFLNDHQQLRKIIKEVEVENIPKAHYLHADVETLDRSDLLDDLRSGNYDVLIGINLLREGLDLPEVSLVAILDADKEGFLRSETSLIQTMGRAARHIHGSVILYADKITGSMQRAINEIKRRRLIQESFNKKYGINPIQITKPIRKKLIDRAEEKTPYNMLDDRKRVEYGKLISIKSDELTPNDLRILIHKLTREMKYAALELNFELASEIRDKIKEIKKTYNII